MRLFICLLLIVGALCVGVFWFRPAAPIGEVGVRLNGAGPDVDGNWRFRFGDRNEMQLRTPAGVSGVRADLIDPDGARHPLAVKAEPEGWNIALGPLLARPAFTYPKGVIEEIGYGLEIVLTDAGHREVQRLPFYQVPSREALPWKYGQRIHRPEGFFAKGEPSAHRFNPANSSGVAVDFFLQDSVLKNNETVQIMAGLRETFSEATMGFLLTGVNAEGTKMLAKNVVLARGKPALLESVNTSAWPDGEYTFRISPIINAATYPDGPRLAYHRDRAQNGPLWISKVLPWRLPIRAVAPSLTIADFTDSSRVQIPPGWEFSGSGPDRALVDQEAVDPVVVRPGLEGFYAVYLTPHDRGCLISIGGENLVRASKMNEEQFVTVADLTGQEIRIYGFDWMQKEGKRTGISRLRFEPVEAGAKDMLGQLGQPEFPLTGIDDWLEYFIGAARIHQDQIRAILQGQNEIGITRVAWSVARSWVEYESALPETSRFPVKPIAEAKLVYPEAVVYEGKSRILDLACPWRTALREAKSLGMTLEAWMGMNRHYGADTLGGIASSEWFVRHPEWRRWRKNAKSADRGEVSFYFPEVREERLRILEEMVSLGARHLVLDTTRQVPMLLYHPEMVAEYLRLFARDPQNIDVSDRENYHHWIAWRADFFTQLLRDLRRRTMATGEGRVEISVRIPATDLVTNMAMGLDVETWLKEKLIDRLMLNPLEVSGGGGLVPVTPYLDLCRKANVSVTVGIGATWMSPASLPAALRRAGGLHAAGVTALDLYEAETAAFLTDFRWAACLFGSPKLLKDFRATSNLEACYPILPETAALGLDNHSRWQGEGWTLHGKGPGSL